MSAQISVAQRRLLKEYRQLLCSAPDGIAAYPISESNLFEWEACLQAPSGTPYHPGVFPCRLNFPPDYPLSPPKLVFNPPIFHPNVYPTGEVCVSILHPAGNDPLGYERPEERWSPVQSIEKILLSVMSLLAEPNGESPANVEASVMWREHRDAFEKKVRAMVRASLGL